MSYRPCCKVLPISATRNLARPIVSRKIRSSLNVFAEEIRWEGIICLIINNVSSGCSFLTFGHANRWPNPRPTNTARMLQRSSNLKMSTPAKRRLMRDFKRLQTDPPAGVSGAPTPDNVMLWNAVIFGPEGKFLHDLLIICRNTLRRWHIQAGFDI